MLTAARLFESLLKDVRASPLLDHQGKRQKLPLSNSGGDFHAFVDDSEALGLWVPLGENDSPVTPDVKSRDLTLRAKNRAGAPYAEIRMTDPRLRSVFHAFVDDYLKEIATSRERAATILASQLVKWRALFIPSPGGELSEEKELGLLAELQVLVELLDIDGDEAFYRWTGPDASRHDFQFEDRDIECKATRSASGLRVKINGDQQLTPGQNGRLLLVIKRYERTPNGELNLPDVIQHLIDHDDVPSEELLSKLFSMGVSLNNLDGQPVRRYNNSETYVFDIGEEFPKLQKVDLPERVVNLTYTLELTPPNEIPGFVADGSLA